MLTHHEEELYDRQIRLWGLNAQSRIRQSKVLMLGFNGVASEVAKILVLAGIDTLTIVDDQKLQESDIHSNLFCRPPADGYRTRDVIAKLKKLNPLVKVRIDNTPIQSKTQEDFKGYDLVTLHSIMTIEEISAINEWCRENKVKFYLVVDFGFFGFMFNDLGDDFTITEEPKEYNTDVSIISEKNDGTKDDEKDNGSDEDSDRPVKKRRIRSPARDGAPQVRLLPYATFNDMISFRNSEFDRQSNPALFISVAILKFYSQYKHLPRAGNLEDITKLEELIGTLKEVSNLDRRVFNRLESDWADNIHDSLSPICAVMGGVAGQDMIRALSNRDTPIFNTFSFDGLTMSGTIEKLGVADDKGVKTKLVVTDFLEIDD